MHLPLHFDAGDSARRMRWFMVAAWFVIAVKCGAVWWAMVHWHVPFHPMWIIAPTVAFAVIASALWLAHQEE